MHAGDIVLVSLREFGDDKADLIHKYFPEEALTLQEMGDIPEGAMIGEGAISDEEGEALEDGDEAEAERFDDADIDNI